jgi:hypothetical protein
MRLLRRAGDARLPILSMFGSQVAPDAVCRKSAVEPSNPVGNVTCRDSVAALAVMATSNHRKCARTASGDERVTAAKPK